MLNDIIKTLKYRHIYLKYINKNNVDKGAYNGIQKL
jgi:hypothetical protein